MIKLIAIDLDGTLLDNNKSISSKNLNVLQEVQRQGVRIVLCSGRPLPGIKPYLNLLDLNKPGNFAITYNGGVVQRTDSGQIISEKILTHRDIISLYQLSREIGVPMNFLDRERVYCPAPPEGVPSLYGLVNQSLPLVHASMDHLPADLKINKAVFCTDQSVLDEAIQSIPESFRRSYTMMKSKTFMFEILNKEADKAHGLEIVGSMLNIRAEEMMALGDQENDLAMIRYAGCGVAMGNAIQEVKDSARFVTKANTDDGVAYAVERFALN